MSEDNVIENELFAVGIAPPVGTWLAFSGGSPPDRGLKFLKAAPESAVVETCKGEPRRETSSRNRFTTVPARLL